MDSYCLYPRLIVSVGLEFLEPVDRELLSNLAGKFGAQGISDEGEKEGLDISREYIMSPRVYGLGNGGYLVDETGADYSLEVQSQILNRWKSLRASEVFLGILKGAQLGLVNRVIFEPRGMYPEKGTPPKIGSIGKKKLSKKRVRNLLKSLRMAHQHYWPIDMLANIVGPCAKRTKRTKRTKESIKSKK